MLADAAGASWYLRGFYRRWARLYYWGVRRYGAKHFNYTDREPALAELLAAA